MLNLFNLLSNNNRNKREPLSDMSTQLLSQQVFTTDQPNAIVKDFETFIEFLKLHKVEVSANQNAIAPKYLADLNKRLSHPIKVDFQRHNQKSYPYIHGLYLLLRGSAIVQVQLDKKKNILQIDSQILQSWQELNDTEKYFNLLVTWIFYADEDIMSNGRNALREWWHVFHSWKDLPKCDRIITKVNQQVSGSYSDLNSRFLRRLPLLICDEEMEEYELEVCRYKFSRRLARKSFLH